MTWFVIIAIIAGIVFGKWVMPAGWEAHLDVITSAALCVMLFGVGIDIGSQREVWRRLWKMGLKVFLLPLAVCIGSLGGAALAGIVLGMPFNESTAIGAGFGWYSLSGVLLAKIYNVETGALAFLTNVSRELMAFLLIPMLAARVGHMAAVAPGGATTMDTTLPLIARVTDPDTAVIALVNGTVLSSLVPLLVPLFISL